MNKFIQTAVCLLSFMTTTVSCGHFDEINTNPDVPTQVTSEMLAIAGIKSLLANSTGKSFMQSYMACKYIAWGELSESYLYNGFGRTGLGNYHTIINMQKMVELSDDKNVKAYSALAKFVKAYILFNSTMELGDIPCSDALKGEEGTLRPKYDTQKEVMLQVIEDLEEAYTLFSNANDFKGDPFVGGKVERWKKIVSTFQLQVLMSLSKKTEDTDLKIKERFSQIVSQSSLMTSNDDNFQMVYSDKAGQLYPFNDNMYSKNPMVSSFLIDMMKETEDYRLFYYAKPSEAQLKAGVAANDWNVFIGTDVTQDFSIHKDAYVNGRFSCVNDRYNYYRPGEPVIRIGYAQQNFILAEAVVRGWIAGDASHYYKQGIKASMDFLTKYTPDEEIYHQGRKITPYYIEHFLEQPSIQLTGDENIDIEKIITQRYIASFMQHPWGAYYEYRRTGYPKFPINPETSLNSNAKDKIPVRWMYPANEYSYNKENVEEAVKRQYDGNDEVNQLMWILK
ncbi:SusD/RagB family nutrient-binding outer membrane lipoprotein [Phocaeicola sp.]|uniref:SusD/RagB family nutrient-binding outer membrane lipoprotein n=1 Tax=Phocaeicola sp. TaxID=2773926 RepID=UPI0023D6EC47|nr:SusD/RagB family nutrient-binding outer membrane lipoprotein [Phocaeicola sp.]MDE5676875.1 SusD/RagB family nutrient-binding outer membrane lipoprotein [Phocaeicola sp.]